MRGYGPTTRRVFTRARTLTRTLARGGLLAIALASSATFAACYTGDGTPDPTKAPDPNPAATCLTPSPGAAPLRRLTQSQYDNTVRDLLGDTTQPATSFPPDETSGEFSNATSLTVSPLLAQGYQTAAEALAAKALTNKAKMLPCDPATAGEDACAKSFIDKFGRRAYRRPLTSDETTALFALYAANKTGGTFDEGIGAVIEAMLQSASFLYRVEYGATGAAQGNVVPLTGYEMASRLSYFLWNSMPDDALLGAADANALATPDQIAAQARRMIADPRAHDATADFFDQWLKLKSLASVSKDAMTYPDFNETLRASMLKETRAFLDWVMWGSDGKVDTLLTSNVSFLDANTAKLYGVPAPVSSGALVKTTLDPSQRAGILTQASLLTIIAKPNQSSPVLRGKFVRERFLCQPLPPPPANLIIVPPEVKPGATTRERFAEHDKNPACAGCHSMMDPIGFGFEHYDGMGKYRTLDQGLPVDATGKLTDTDVDGDFDGAPALAAKLAQSKDVKECIATEWFRYAFGRGETQEDSCSLGAAKQAFAGKEYDMRELLVAITLTDGFRFRPEVKP